MPEIKSSFVRGLWGIHEHKGDRLLERRSKIDNDIKLALTIKYKFPLMNYVFGEDNYKYLIDLGFSAKLVDKKPIAWDMHTQQFRHKLEVLKQGLVDFDEVVLLDWDCIPIKELPKNLWKVLRKKAPLQAILSIYKRKKAIWREKGIDIRKIPCGSFVYLNNKKIADDLIKTWEELGCPWSEEVVIAKYLDRVTGGWKGVDHYIEHYEPDFFQLLPQQAWMLDKIKWKTLVFQHYNRHHVSSMLQVEEAKKKKNEEN